MTPQDCILFSGGAPGAEAEFGRTAERHGLDEVNFTFEGHRIERHRGVRVLNHEELQSGDVSLEYVARLMHRRYTDAPTIRRVLQTLWYQVNNGQEIYVVGVIQTDGTVRGGTGWGAEFAKLCNKPLHVFDQEKDRWFSWSGSDWQPRPAADGPVITHPHFTGTGTRTLAENGRSAIAELFKRSFAAAAIVLVMLAWASAPAAAQQSPFKPPSNLRVLPTDTKLAAIIPMMKNFTQALGVRCQFCHSYTGSDPDALENFDFPSDAVQAKTTARKMMAMVLTINGDLLKDIGAPPDGQLKVTCFTCHRGERTPLTAKPGQGPLS